MQFYVYTESDYFNSLINKEINDIYQNSIELTYKEFKKNTGFKIKLMRKLMNSYL